MITKDYTQGIDPERVVAEMLAAFASMPIETQQRVARTVLDYDSSLILESLVPNLLAGLTEAERSQALQCLKKFHGISIKETQHV